MFTHNLTSIFNIFVEGCANQYLTILSNLFIVQDRLLNILKFVILLVSIPIFLRIKFKIDLKFSYITMLSIIFVVTPTIIIYSIANSTNFNIIGHIIVCSILFVQIVVFRELLIKYFRI